jgi:hypothetical protein
LQCNLTRFSWAEIDVSTQAGIGCSLTLKKNVHELYGYVKKLNKTQNRQALKQLT